MSENLPLIECIPNFSEGRDMNRIQQIIHEIEKVRGARVLHVDPGKAANRTVVTFAGNPGAVLEAAFLAIKKAAEIIDMREHHGEHPRIGATDVCPLVPVSGISMMEVIACARRLGDRVGQELSIPGYYYEYAATDPVHRNLSDCRKGEYEGLREKLTDPAWIPDFGPPEFNARSGATVIGAREFLIAYNINLNTTSRKLARHIASVIREKGRHIKHDSNDRDSNHSGSGGPAGFIPGVLKNVKGMGWYISEYGFAQVSLNLTNYKITPMHKAFEEATRQAEKLGVQVTGSELIGLVPLQAVLDTGRYYLNKKEKSGLPSDNELVDTAVRSLGLDQISPFEPQKRILEYVLAQ